MNNSNSSVGRDFKKLYEQAVKSLGKYDPETGKGHYALMNMDEFFVGLFTNAKFIKDLSAIEATDTFKYKNLFEEIIDQILNLLNINKGSSLYDQSVAVATNILDYQREQVDALYDQAQVDQFVIETPWNTTISTEVTFDPSIAKNFDPSDLISPGGKPGIEPTSLTCK